LDLFDPPAERHSPPGERDVYSVTRLNQAARGLLERGFGTIWLEGELSNFSRPASGHWYFSVKDPSAQVRCAMFRSRNRLLRSVPRDGQQLLLRARVSLYEPRGDYQLIVEHLEEAGAGRLMRLFEETRQRLEDEGLFAAQHKRALPDWPRRIGVITSPSGAAVRDVLQVLARRYPAAAVLVYPVPVQGAGAALKIARAIERADTRGDCDVLLLVRGGGSLEDLWSFNEESVARAIHACATPLVSGVGHEVDTTIADLVADARAPTPSAAAELVSPDGPALLARLAGLAARLDARIERQQRARAERLSMLLRRLRQQHPRRRLGQRAQRVDELELRLRRALARRQRAQRQRLDHAATLLQRHSPARPLSERRAAVRALRARLDAGLRRRLDGQRAGLQSLARALDAVSPLATLSRGYAVLQRADGNALRDASQAQIGEHLHARLAHGNLDCEVIAVRDGAGQSPATTGSDASGDTPPRGPEPGA